jgi:hypothetical protein
MENQQLLVFVDAENREMKKNCGGTILMMQNDSFEGKEKIMNNINVHEKTNRLKISVNKNIDRNLKSSELENDFIKINRYKIKYNDFYHLLYQQHKESQISPLLYKIGKKKKI